MAAALAGRPPVPASLRLLPPLPVPAPLHLRTRARASSASTSISPSPALLWLRFRARARAPRPILASSAACRRWLSNRAVAAAAPTATATSISAANATAPAMSSAPQRVVSLLPSATEVFLLIEAEHARDRTSPSTSTCTSTTNAYTGVLVGRSHECDYPASIQHLPVLTGARTHGEDSMEIHKQVQEALATESSLYTLDAELLSRLQPDVILTQDLCNVCSIDTPTVERVLSCGMASMTSARPSLPTSSSTAADATFSPALVNLNPKDLWDVLDTFRQVGEAVHMPEAAERVRAAYLARIELARQRGREQRARTLSSVGRLNVGFIEWLSPIFPGGHWTPQMIEYAGAQHVLSSARLPSDVIPPELVISANPSHLIIAPCGMSLAQTRRELAKVIARRADWFFSIDAVRNNRVALVDGNQMFNRPGPRLVDALEWLVGWLHQRHEWIPQDFPWEPFDATSLRTEIDAFDRERHVNVAKATNAAKATSAVNATSEATTTNAAATPTTTATPQVAPAAPAAPRATSPGRRTGAKAVFQPLAPEIEACHQAACAAGRTTYIDPHTGLTVFTELAHRQRGFCCGNRCRHCAFGHFNVPPARGQRMSPITKPTFLKVAHYERDIPHVDVLFWSGGKDSYLALLALLREQKQRMPPTSAAAPSSSSSSLLHSIASSVASAFSSSVTTSAPSSTNDDATSTTSTTAATTTTNTTYPRRIVLLTTFDEATGVVPHQNVSIHTIMDQVKAIGLDLIVVPLPAQCGNDEYVRLVNDALPRALLPQMAVAAAPALTTALHEHVRIVFGDLHLQDIRTWREQQFAGFVTAFPVFGTSYDELMRVLEQHADASAGAGAGAGAAVGATKSSSQRVVWKSPADVPMPRHSRIEICAVAHEIAPSIVQVGSTFDRAWFERTRASAAAAAVGSIDAFGECGEFHTFVQIVPRAFHKP